MSAPALPWRRILVTADFSPASPAAVRCARALAAERGAALTVLNVVEPFSADWKMDTSGRRRHDRAEAGRVVRRAPCAVLVVRAEAGRGKTN